MKPNFQRSTKCFEHQLTQSQTRIQELEGLVREMGEKFENIRVYTFSDPEGNELQRILSRPEVKAIMENKP